MCTLEVEEWRCCKGAYAADYFRLFCRFWVLCDRRGAQGHGRLRLWARGCDRLELKASHKKTASTSETELQQSDQLLVRSKYGRDDELEEAIMMSAIRMSGVTVNRMFGEVAVKREMKGLRRAV